MVESESSSQESSEAANPPAISLARLRDAVAKQPASLAAWQALAAALHAAADYPGAADALREAVALCPDDASLRCDWAIVLQLAGASEAAVEQYARAVELDVTLRRAWYNLGCLYNTLDREAEAVPCFRRALELEPAHAPSHHNLGQALFNLGETDAAIQHYRRALELGAGGLAETTLAMSIAISQTADPQTVLETRRQWARRQLPGPMFSPRRKASKGKRLRIGYVSAFFDRPNWMKPVWQLINRHDREQFDVVLYSDGKSPRPDGYRPHERDRFHITSRLSNVEMARLIAADELDLLIDLNGFSRVSRLPVFALRPAPVNIGWFNMFATTGMEAFDYLIGDEIVTLPEEQADYREKIVRLKGCYLTFEVAYPTPEIERSRGESTDAASNALGDDFTFGSLASLYKLTPDVLDVWSKILVRAPHSRLLLRNQGFSSSGNREWIREAFVRRGVEPARLTLQGPAAHFEFLRTYGSIDLTLDPFPYNGGTTTSEALWQGTPVLAILGDRWTSRVSASLLTHAGLSEFIAKTPAEHVDLAVAIATTSNWRSRLSELRGSMRERLRASSVCDTETFTRQMERIYLELVRN